MCRPFSFLARTGKILWDSKKLVRQVWRQNRGSTLTKQSRTVNLSFRGRPTTLQERERLIYKMVSFYRIKRKAFLGDIQLAPPELTFLSCSKNTTENSWQWRITEQCMCENNKDWSITWLWQSPDKRQGSLGSSKFNSLDGVKILTARQSAERTTKGGPCTFKRSGTVSIVAKAREGGLGEEREGP